MALKVPAWAFTSMGLKHVCAVWFSLQILFWAKRKIMSTNNLVLISYRFGKRYNLTWQIRFVGICFKIFYFFLRVSFFLTFVCISLFGRGERNCANIQLVKVACFVFFWNVKRDWWSLCFDDGCCIYVLNSNSQRLLKHTSSTFHKKSEIALKWADKMTQVCAFYRHALLSRLTRIPQILTLYF